MGWCFPGCEAEYAFKVCLEVHTHASLTVTRHSMNQMLLHCSGQTEGYGGGDAWGGQTPRTQLSGSAMERNVARLFRDRVKFTAAVEFTQASILAGLSDATSRFAACCWLCTQ